MCSWSGCNVGEKCCSLSPHAGSERRTTPSLSSPSRLSILLPLECRQLSNVRQYFIRLTNLMYLSSVAQSMVWLPVSHSQSSKPYSIVTVAVTLNSPGFPVPWDFWLLPFYHRYTGVFWPREFITSELLLLILSNLKSICGLSANSPV